MIEPVVWANTFRIDAASIFADAGGAIVEQHTGTDMGKPPVRAAELVRVKVEPANLQLNMEVAGYVFPEPAFEDVVPGDSTRYGRAVYTELSNIAFQIVQLVRKIEQVP